MNNKKNLLNIYVLLENGTELVFKNAKIFKPFSNDTALIEIWKNNTLFKVESIKNIKNIKTEPILENLNEII